MRVLHRKPKRWHYLVSYACTQGFGSSHMISPQPYTTWEQIQECRDIFARENGHTSVVILNFQLLRVDRGTPADSIAERQREMDAKP